MNEIYYNSKRFQILSLQNLANHLYQRQVFEGAYAVAKLVQALISSLENADPIYKKINQIESNRERADIKQKIDARNKNIQVIIQTISNKKPEIAQADAKKRKGDATGDEMAHSEQVDQENYKKWVGSLSPISSLKLVEPAYLENVQNIKKVQGLYHAVLAYELARIESTQAPFPLTDA